MALAGRVACLAGCLVSAACVRPPLDGFCTEMAPGDLVVTELRGPQASNSSYRQWFELYNASDAARSLYGVRLVFTKNDGKASAGFVIRDDLEVEPGGYVVIGGGDPAAEPYIDYDYTPDYHSEPGPDDPPDKPPDPRDLYKAATLEVYACEVLVDVVLYTLPEEGTLALDGASAPDAAANDDSDEGWCADVSVGMGPQTEIGLRGSPGEANPPCP